MHKLLVILFEIDIPFLECSIDQKQDLWPKGKVCLEGQSTATAVL